MCELILSTIANPKFVQLLYGDVDQQRGEILLDLYLNTPDKGLNETPLHFAVKFGQIDAVKVLVSYSQCVKTVLNKYKQTPLEVNFYFTKLISLLSLFFYLLYFQFYLYRLLFIFFNSLITVSLRKKTWR